MPALLIVLGVIVLIALFLIGGYNRLVALRNNREQAFSDIDVQMKQRYDLVPNLIETVKGYAKHEKELLENVTNARAKAVSAGSIDDKIAAENQFAGTLRSLFAVAENYPDLKANTNFLSLQTELSDLENKISAARRFFNNATKEYNTTLQSFPTNVIAGMFGFAQGTFFDLGEERAAVSKPVEVKF